MKAAWDNLEQVGRTAALMMHGGSGTGSVSRDVLKKGKAME